MRQARWYGRAMTAKCTCGESKGESARGLE